MVLSASQTGRNCRNEKDWRGGKEHSDSQEYWISHYSLEMGCRVSIDVSSLQRWGELTWDEGTHVPFKPLFLGLHVETKFSGWSTKGPTAHTQSPALYTVSKFTSCFLGLLFSVRIPFLQPSDIVNLETLRQPPSPHHPSSFRFRWQQVLHYPSFLAVIDISVVNISNMVSTCFS